MMNSDDAPINVIPPIIVGGLVALAGAQVLNVPGPWYLYFFIGAWATAGLMLIAVKRQTRRLRKELGL